MRVQVRAPLVVIGLYSLLDTLSRTRPYGSCFIDNTGRSHELKALRGLAERPSDRSASDIRRGRHHAARPAR